MSITSLPNPIPDNLADIQSLITERFDAIDALDIEIEAKKSDKSILKDEISQLQDAGKKLLMITPKPPKATYDKDPISGEKIDKEK